MTKKKNSEFEQLEQAAAEQAESPDSRIFDFTKVTLDEESKNVYFLLRRAAILAGDESLLPDGKSYTEAEVKKILGEDYAYRGSDTKCCG